MKQSKLSRTLKLQLFAGMAMALSQPLQAGAAYAAGGPVVAGPVAMMAMMVGIIGPGGGGSCGAPGPGGGANFGTVAQCMQKSVENVPGLLTALAYLLGLMLGSMAIVKMKEHVENPSNTPLRDSAVRMAAGGALFALPIVYEAMVNTAGNNGQTTSAAMLNRARFNVQ